MKTLEKIKKEVRQEFDMVEGWNLGGDTSDDTFCNEVAKRYAKSVSEYLREMIADEAKTHNIGCFGRDPYIVVDTDSIRNVEIILP